MTAPLDDDPFGEPPATSRLAVVRELSGALLALSGLTLLITVLADVDTRLAVGAGSVLLVACGLWLARDNKGD